jgi:outer membrane protein assembly factor BamD (BamD/ComL family)
MAPPEPVAVERAEEPAVAAPAPNPTLDSIAHSNRLIEARDYDGAIKVLEEAIKQHPAEAVLQYHLGFAYWYKAAFKKDGVLRKTMERSPYRRARQAFETFIKQAPNHPRAADARVRLDILRRAQFGYARE